MPVSLLHLDLPENPLVRLDELVDSRSRKFLQLSRTGFDVFDCRLKAGRQVGSLESLDGFEVPNPLRDARPGYHSCFLPDRIFLIFPLFQVSEFHGVYFPKGLDNLGLPYDLSGESVRFQEIFP